MNKNKITSGHILVSAFMLLIAFVAVTGLWGVLITRSGPLAEKTIFEVGQGHGVSVIAEKLENQGVVSSSTLFKVSAVMMFADKGLQAGAYEFDAGIPLRDVIKKMARGHTAQFKVTIPEGLRTSEVLQILMDAPYVTGDFSTIKLKEDDLLLPETYMYNYGESVHSILSRMEGAMEVALNNAWENRQNGLPIKSKEELLTLASMVEKETNIISEMPEVAGVFVNRLNKGMRLQSDPTVIYGLNDYNGDITRKHLRTMHPFNTYMIRGLPRHAIAHPGIAAINAAANPNATENLYFVADMKGGHVFAKTLEQHNKNVQDYLKAYKAFIAQ